MEEPARGDAVTIARRPGGPIAAAAVLALMAGALAAYSTAQPAVRLTAFPIAFVTLVVAGLALLAVRSRLVIDTTSVTRRGSIRTRVVNRDEVADAVAFSAGREGLQVALLPATGRPLLILATRDWASDPVTALGAAWGVPIASCGRVQRADMRRLYPNTRWPSGPFNRSSGR